MRATVFPLIKTLKTMRTENELDGVTLLGNQHVQYSDNYNPGVLETFPNKHPENEYLVTFNWTLVISTLVISRVSAW